MEISPGIVVDSRVHFGKPVIKGTRVPVSVVLQQLATGADREEIAREYGITEGDILAVLRYAAEIVGREEVRAP